jgi:DNA polymerase-3 subunit gamma/tau
MNYIVSALKYRPRKFEEVIGQQAVTNTLKNAVEKDKLAKALLFTGPRGVGKTTCARILAREINKSEGLSTDEDFAFNIFELDAASNNSVDDIRNLIDQVRIPPQTGKYKVYIIDEVHMLSQAAFNAFLKTLEEPPAHAIFILATTEKHKIIPTILSRCQIYDFKRISAFDIKEHLMKIADKEGIEADEDALFLIAQKADGALRDALSMFDKVVSYSDGKITRKVVSESMAILDYNAYFTTVDLMLKNDIPGLLNFFNEILHQGFDAHQFIAGLSAHLRDLLVAKDSKTVELMEVSDNIKQKYIEQSQQIPLNFLMRAIDLSMEGDLQYKLSKNPHLLVELTLMKLASLTQSEEVKKKVVNILPASSFRKTPQITEDKSLQKTVQEKEAIYNKKDSEQEIKDTSLPKTDKSKANKAGLSLKSLRRKKMEQEQNYLKNGDLPEDPFSIEEFQHLWDKFLENLRKNNDRYLLSLFNSDKPVIEGNNILMKVATSTIKDEILQNKDRILRFLRKNLNNYKIDFSIEVSEQKEKEFIYYPEEKLEKLLEKYPDLSYLIDKWKLEL